MKVGDVGVNDLPDGAQRLLNHFRSRTEDRTEDINPGGAGPESEASEHAVSAAENDSVDEDE